MANEQSRKTVLMLCAANPDFLRRGRMNALQLARSEFNWQRYSPTLHELYAGTTR